MNVYDFTPPPEVEHHQCNGYGDGEWIVYSCPKCDYEMRENRQTGEMKVKNVKMEIRHSGSYMSPEMSGYLDNVH